MRRLAFLLALTPLAAACSHALSPAEMRAEATPMLCHFYSAPMHPDHRRPELRQELERRGATECTEPAAVAARTRSAVTTAVFGPGIGKLDRAVRGVPGPTIP